MEVELDEMEVAKMQVLLMKLASGGLTQNFTQEEYQLLTRMRESKDTILRIFYEEIRNARSINDRGREKIDNLIRIVEKICK